jgi:hypothetical protein
LRNLFSDVPVSLFLLDIPKKKRKAEVMEGIMETMEAGGTEDD